MIVSSVDMVAPLHHAAFDRRGRGDRANDDEYAEASHDVAQAIIQNIGDGEAQQRDRQHGDQAHQSARR